MGDHYSVQGHSRSLILVPIESPRCNFYLWIILTDILSRTITQLSCNIIAFDGRRGTTL